MSRVPFQSGLVDPRRVGNFLDSCAFDPKYSPENEAARTILDLGASGEINLLVAHSTQKELDHPNTPADVKREAVGMQYTLNTSKTIREVEQRSQIHAILTGDGSPENYAADAEHVFEAGKYGGCFITADRRILTKRRELSSICMARIVKPSEWLALYNESGNLP